MAPAACPVMEQKTFIRFWSGPGRLGFVNLELRLFHPLVKSCLVKDVFDADSHIGDP